MEGKKWLILVVALGIVLLSNGIGVTRSSFADPESTTGNDFQAWASRQWTQTTKAEFEAGVLNQVDTSSSAGDVKLGTTYSLLEPTTSTGSEGSWHFTAWSRRAPVTINNSGSALTDFQVRVDVTYDADMQPDFDDIRFVDSDDSTELSHWRESYTASTSAIFWVKVPSIPSGDKTIYMYYGNDAASSASDGNATFIFFDDFSGDLSKWTTIAGTWAIDAGRLTTTSGTGRTAIYGTGTSFGNAIIEFKSTAPPTTADHNIGSYHRGDGTVADTNAWLRFYWDTIIEDWKLKDGVTVYANATGDSLEGVWRNQKIVMVGNTQQLYVDGTLKIDYTGASGTNPGKVGVISYASAYLAGKYWDDYRVHKYASPEPTTSVGSEDGWSRRAPVTINNSGSALTDFQVRVDVTYDADMQPDFDDIRFRDSDGSTELSHWRESYTDSASAIFWVKVPSIPSDDKTIYMYYGHDAASSASDGDATFIFFDDFSGDLSKWNIHIDTDVAITSSYGNPAPSLEISGGITSSPYGFAAIGSDATYTGFQDGIIEADIYPATVALPEIIFRGNYSANTGYKGRWDCRSGSESPWMKPPYSGWSAFGTAVTRFGIANQWQKAKLVIIGSTFMIYSNGNLKSTVINTQYSGPGEIGLANHYGTYARFDNVRVRKCASQPVYFSSGTIASQVRNTGVAGARWDALFWDETLESVTNITFHVRASNTSFAQGAASPSWTLVGDTSPVTSGLPSGQYMQWRATLTTSDTSKTPTLHEVRVYHY